MPCCILISGFWKPFCEAYFRPRALGHSLGSSCGIDLGPEGQQRPSQPVSQSLRPPALGLGRPLASTSTHSLQTASDEIIKSMVSWSTPPSLSPALAACPHKHPRPVSGPACPGPSTQSGGTWVAGGVGDTCDDTHPGWRRHLAPAGRAAGHTDPISLRG